MLGGSQCGAGATIAIELMANWVMPSVHSMAAALSRILPSLAANAGCRCLG